MGLLILLAIGATLGWLTVIIFMESDREAVYTAIGAGAVGAVAIGLLTSSTSIIYGLTLNTILCAAIGAIVTATLGYFANRALVKQKA